MYRRVNTGSALSYMKGYRNSTTAAANYPLNYQVVNYTTDGATSVISYEYVIEITVHGYFTDFLTGGQSLKD
jgi:hypothetical protein